MRLAIPVLKVRLGSPDRLFSLDRPARQAGISIPD